MLLSANYLSSKMMSLNLFKSKETSDLTEYNLRIVLCGNAIGGFSCSEIQIRLRFLCPVTALIFASVDCFLACMWELFIENIKTRKQFPPLLLPPKTQASLLCSCSMGCFRCLTADRCSLDQQLRNTDPEGLFFCLTKAIGQIPSSLYCISVCAAGGFYCNAY